jgi:hypothetical protein
VTAEAPVVKIPVGSTVPVPTVSPVLIAKPIAFPACSAISALISNPASVSNSFATGTRNEYLYAPKVRELNVGSLSAIAEPATLIVAVERAVRVGMVRFSPLKRC